MNSATPVLSGVLLLLWLHCFLVLCLAVDYDYRESSPNGPTHWGDLNRPNWIECKNGTNQSPISITSTVPQPNMPLDLVYTTAPIDALIYNDGHTVVVKMVHQNSGNITISSVIYYLEDFHFHIPIEHKTGDTESLYLIEMHLMHKSKSGQVAAVALLYEPGVGNLFSSKFFDNLPSFKIPNVTTPIEITLPIIDPNIIFRYNGSLTTPPCTEIVVWTIINDFSHTLSYRHYKQLRAALPMLNARPIQLLNGRKVYRIHR